ncbi:MAG: hypothetical protein ACFFDT_26235 [Candidatus Hodarchaeota archaeon]
MRIIFIIITISIVTTSCSFDTVADDINYEGYYIMSPSAEYGKDEVFAKLQKENNEKAKANYTLRLTNGYGPVYFKIFSPGKVKITGGTAFGEHTTTRGHGKFDSQKKLSGKLTIRGYSPEIPLPFAISRNTVGWALRPATLENILEAIIDELNKNSQHFFVPAHFVKYMDFEATYSALGLDWSFCDNRFVFNLIRVGDIQFEKIKTNDVSLRTQFEFKYRGVYSLDSISDVSSDESRHRDMTDQELKYFITKINITKLGGDNLRWFKDRNWVIGVLSDPQIIQRVLRIAMVTGDMRIIENFTRFSQMFLPEHDKSKALAEEWTSIKEKSGNEIPPFGENEKLYCNSQKIVGKWMRYDDPNHKNLDQLNIEGIEFPTYEIAPAKGYSIEFFKDCTVSSEGKAKGKWDWHNNRLRFSLIRYPQNDKDWIHSGELFLNNIVGHSEKKGFRGGTWILKRHNRIQPALSLQ